MVYEITEYTKKKAKQLGVTVKPSDKKKKKIDVYKDNKKIASIGNIDYGDYSTFLQTKGKGKVYADERKRLYRIRHKKDINVIGSNGFYAKALLW